MFHSVNSMNFTLNPTVGWGRNKGHHYLPGAYDVPRNTLSTLI